MTAEKSIGKEMLPYPREVVDARAKFLETVYFPDSITSGKMSDNNVALSGLVKQALEKIVPDTSKWHTLVEFTDFIAGSSTGTRETAIRARFGFDDGRIKKWNEVGEISGKITDTAAHQRVSNAIENLRASGRGSRVRMAMIFKFHLDAFS